MMTNSQSEFATFDRRPKVGPFRSPVRDPGGVTGPLGRGNLPRRRIWRGKSANFSYEKFVLKFKNFRENFVKNNFNKLKLFLGFPPEAENHPAGP